MPRRVCTVLRRTGVKHLPGSIAGRSPGCWQKYHPARAAERHRSQRGANEKDDLACSSQSRRDDGCGVWAGEAGRKPNDTFEQTLIADERALLAAVAKTDKSAFVALVLPEATWTTRQGFVPMNLLADGLLGFDVTKWEIINPHVIRLTDDSAVVIYLWSGTGTLARPTAPGDDARIDRLDQT